MNLAHETVQLVGCSVKGPSHEENGIPCQDSWHGHRLSEEQFVIAVGDGLGSASLSQIGSDIATSKAADVLKEYLSSVETIRQGEAKNALDEARSEAKTALLEEAGRRDVPAAELTTTLLTAVVGPSGIAGAIVGDGGIVCEYRGDYHLLVPREESIVDLSSSNKTYDLLHDEWQKSYRFDFRKEATGVAVFSDGLSEFAWDGIQTAKPEFFEAAFTLVRDTPDSDEAETKLRNTLNDSPYHDFSDDKTIAIGTLPYESAGETVETASGEVLQIGEKVSSFSDDPIYRIKESDGEVVKIFSQAKRRNSKLSQKIEEMVDDPSEDWSYNHGGIAFAWPSELVVSTDEGGFLGYKTSVPEIGHRPPISEFARENSEERERPTGVIQTVFGAISRGGGKNLDRSYELGLDLARSVRALHDKGHAVGDFNDQNILIDDSGILWMNCDGFHIMSGNTLYEGHSLHSRYAPPEDPSDSTESVQLCDRFGLAVHIFQLLMDGYHPYQARGPNATDGSIEEMIPGNSFPYQEPQPDRLEPPEDSPSYENLPSNVRARFEQCFVEGKSDPEKRPSPQVWEKTLKSVGNSGK